MNLFWCYQTYQLNHTCHWKHEMYLQAQHLHFLLYFYIVIIMLCIIKIKGKQHT